jgi:predicted DNA-binding antitoxin AbrB/MazE fold protein
VERLEIEAVYDRGTLKLASELPLADGQKVVITIRAAGKAVKRPSGLIHWKGSQADLDHLILSEENDPLEAP